MDSIENGKINFGYKGHQYSVAVKQLFDIVMGCLIADDDMLDFYDIDALKRMSKQHRIDIIKNFIFMHEQDILPQIYAFRVRL